ncbi:GIY-YIG nuclease family protein [Archaeoglobus sp.]
MKGTYLLFLRLRNDKCIKVGRLGRIEFRRGWYVYVGSGMNSLIKRVARHFKRTKKMRWHIDYLSIQADEIVAFLIPNVRLECDLAKYLAKRFEYIEGFGCSDCNCVSHLFYLGNLLKPDKNVKS